MEYGDIKFLFRKSLNKEESLNIRLKIKDINLREIQLYKGKTKIKNIKCKEEFYCDSNFIYIKNKSRDFILEYEVLIGSLGKHGKGGEIEEDLISFMGEQILLLPVEMLTMSDDLMLNCILEIDFTNLIEDIKSEVYSEKDYKSIIPFKEGDFKSKCVGGTWSDLYEIMKSSYTFGFFEEVVLKKEYGEVHLYYSVENEFLNTINKEELVRNIKSICDYYYDLFKIDFLNKKDLNIVLLRKSKNENSYILGGSGKNLISATFDMNKKRDWQLLSHRIFHAFMDHVLKSRVYHLPPNLWLTEGLATYYENLALESLEEELKERLDIKFKKEMAILYTRYLYMTLKEPSRFKIIPMEEGSIRSHGKIEFLHYTKAPLLVYFLETLNNSCGNKNEIIEYLINNKDKSFSMQNLFYNLLGFQCDSFASKYLFGNSIIPLWDLKENLDDKDVICTLQEYEYILWTWFLGEKENYIEDDLRAYNKKIEEIISCRNINIYNSYLTKQIEDYSKELSFLLKAWIIRSNVCNVSSQDENIRYKLLKDKVNLRIWNEFLEQSIKNKMNI
ncbi:MAG: hypothetical protein KIB11_04115 [Clostridium perfringens]|uniref:Uncharacterized protein n=1 Tax=Clostridium perfringens TaxID=1502 RepID=A0AAP4EF82_CLOPF|nr:hypothetical protein [Clostridium perfringens]MBS5968296.1 hypothetical protein [Clostridium perfringens]MDH2335809.1 hypothetical protein [Clostridium perfringens]